MSEEHDYIAEMVKAASRPKSILLIDDCEADRSFFRQLINGHFAELDEANSGEAGVRMAAEKNYNLILCDVVMPGQSGVETIKQIKLIRRGQGVSQPIVSFSGVYTADLASQLQRAGCVVQAHKPDCFTQDYMDDLLGVFGIPRLSKK